MPDSLLYDFESSTDKFFEWVRMCCGFDEESDTYALLKYLIIDPKTLNTFIDDFYDGDYNNLWNSAINMLQRDTYKQHDLGLDGLVL